MEEGQLIKDVGNQQSKLGESFTSVNPATGEVVWQGYAATPSEVLEAVGRARNAAQHWAAMSFSDRKVIVERFSNLMSTNRSVITECISQETGKPLWESDTEVTAMVNKVAISIDAYATRTGQQSFDGMGLVHRPLGVMAVFGPYNFPGHLPNGHIVPALLAGNSVVFKPSELTPKTAELYVGMWQQAGLPIGVIELVHGGPDIGKQLVGANIDAVLFTGSSNTGTHIHKALAGRPNVLLALEMGGNNPLVVSNCASVEYAARIIVISAFISAGQRCTCARRLIMTRSDVNHAILQRVIEISRTLVVGPPSGGESVFMGPLISSDVVDAALAVQDRWLENGAQSLLLAERLDAGQAFMSAGIIDQTNNDSFDDSEIFAPLLSVFWVDSNEEAVACANNTQYGLAAGLLTDDVNFQKQFIEQVRAGVVSVNKPTTGAPSRLPFGGVGISGNYRPSAYYAADYCAWPQAQVLGTLSSDMDMPIIKGLNE